MVNDIKDKAVSDALSLAASNTRTSDASIENLIRCEASYGGSLIVGNSIEVRKEKPKLLLHSCCGPCSSSVIERLAGEFDVSVFFYNPCITDEEEYKRRREAQIKFIDIFNRAKNGAECFSEAVSRHEGRCMRVQAQSESEILDGELNSENSTIAGISTLDANKVAFHEGPYEPGAFLAKVTGYENDPEGGARCGFCFRQRLEKTAEAASIMGCDYFATTLTVSPHKNYQVISEIGREIAGKYGLTFLDRDFKKQDGFKRSIELSKKYNLYRQNYCGCEFSRWEK